MTQSVTATAAAVDAGAAPSLEPAVLDALRKHWGFETLRPLQAHSLAATLAGRDSLTVLPTGGGKSLCFQLPPLVTGRVTLVISPLIALMEDQVAGLKVAGVPAAALHSNLTPEALAEVRRMVAARELRILFTSPERLLSSGFMSFLGKLDIGHVAIDEAHCISQWGHDFRPEFRRMRELRSALPGVPMGAYTATATPRVRQDIIDQLGLASPVEVLGNFDRPNLTYRVLPRVRVVDQVAEAIGRHAGRAAIVYCLSRKNTEEVAAALCTRGIVAKAYHAGMDAKRRSTVSAEFRGERLDVVVATVAFGMGIDRGDVRLVVHASMPKSIEHYQQETGRAGRDGLPAECLLLYSAQDMVLWRDLMSKPGPDGSVATPEVLAHASEMLERMHRFASGARCRHRGLVEYFGQTFETANCNACDFCLDELEDLPDAQDTARKIVSCVARITAGREAGYGFGVGHICDVLAGSRAEKVLRLGHDKLTTHGMLRHIAKDRLSSYVNQLVDQGVLDRVGEFNVLTLTEQSRALLKNEAQVRLVDPKAVLTRTRREQVATGEEAPLSPAEADVFEALRDWRRTEAETRGVPPYVLLNDATLEELARVRPASLETLVSVRGIGLRKADDFGKSLLAALATSARMNSLGLDARPGSRPRTYRESDTPKRTSGSESAGVQFERGMPLDEVATITGRSRSTVSNYLAQWIEASKPASIDPWVPSRTQKRVIEAWEKTKRSGMMRQVWEALNAGMPESEIISYDEIKITLAFARASETR